MKKKKVIVTRKVKKWKILDRLAWLIPVLVGMKLIIGIQGSFLQELAFVFADSTVAGIVFLIMVFWLIMLVAAPLMLIWWAVTHTVKRSVMRNTTFNVLQNLDYFRDRFAGVTPADISMLTDLEIEPKKDIAALLLKYTMLGLVTTDHGTVTVVGFQHPELQESDRFLLYAIADDKVDVGVTVKWKNMARDEVVDKGYLKNTRRDANGKQNGCGVASSIGCLLPILIWITGSVFAMTSSMFQDFSNMLDSLDDSATNLDLINTLLASPEVGAATAVSAVVAGLCMIALILPVVGLIYLVVSSANSNSYKRTEIGEELTEEIYGMKNFIHDFSELSHADKEQLILWDDFLIYAVLLEENTSIVDEICDMRHIRRIPLPKIWEV